MGRIYEINNESSIINDLYRNGESWNFLKTKLRENDIYVIKNGSQSVITRVKDQQFKTIEPKKILGKIKGENKEQQILISSSYR